MNGSPETHEFCYQRTDFALLAFFVLFLTLPFWINLRNLPSTTDPALEMLAFARIFVDSIWNHYRFPMWNPFFGGGIPWAGVVWNPSLTPLSLILVSFGEVVGFKVWFALVLFCGTMDMYRICTDILRTSRVAALLSGMFFQARSGRPGDNRLAVNTGKNFCEPSSNVLNFNYDRRWSTRRGTIMNHDGLLAVELPAGDNRNRSIVLIIRIRCFS